MSIRYKIFGAFSVVILLACGLAFYGIRGISTAGDQVVRLYDGPLMGINHARSAHAGLNEARLIMQRSLIDGATSDAVARFEKLVRNIFEDLSVVRDRVQSASVKTAREKAEAGLRGWSGAGLKILKPAPGGLAEIPTTFSLMQQGDEAAASLDDLVELVAAYGFDYRTEAEASVAEARTAMLGIALGTAFVGIIIAIAFAYSLSKPISAAVRIAERVASGNFADDITVRRRDELGRLLKSLAVMQASLRARADQDLALMSSKDETHAQQFNRRQRIGGDRSRPFHLHRRVGQHRPDNRRIDEHRADAFLHRARCRQAIRRDGVDRGPNLGQRSDRSNRRQPARRFRAGDQDAGQ
jgi:methyl-accepting chemotaxis protein